MTTEEAILFLESLVNYEKKAPPSYKASFKLERMKKFLSHIGDPQKDLKVIHVAGTKGKGSTACFIANILKEEGWRVGLYTSPHLKDFRERIRILDPNNTADEQVSFPGMILKNDLNAILEMLKPSIETFGTSLHHLGALTFFEVLTAVAFIYFRNKNVDFAVLETGLGGRFDATNSAQALVSVITPVSYDHEHILGSTLAEIGFEKAGIIKSSNRKTSDGFCVSVTAAQEREVLTVLRRRADTEGSVLFELNKDFLFKRLKGDLSSQDFFYRGLNDNSFFLKTRMLGIHQLVNASLALAACEALSLFGIRVRSDALSAGIEKAFWPGRLEVVRTQPFVILDGAHNKDSTTRLIYFLQREFKKYRKWLVFGASMDKDIKGIAELLDPFVQKIILTRSANPRAADPEKVLAPYFKNNVVRITHSVEEAMEVIGKEAQPEDVAVVTGSLFVVGEARDICRK